MAGVWVDRLSKRRVLRATNSVALAQSLAMLALVISGEIQPWHLIAGNLVLGIVNAFDSPARQSFLIELVEGRTDLPSAIAFQSMLMNGARFVGPMVGGAVIALGGEAWGFGLNSASYVAILAALAAVRVQPRQPEGTHQGWLAQLATGFRWAYGFLPSRSILLLLAAVSVGTQPLQALAPFFARDVFSGDSQTLGWMIGAGGLGAVTGMLFLALRPTVRGLLTVIGWAGVVGASPIRTSSTAPSLTPVVTWSCTERTLPSGCRASSRRAAGSSAPRARTRTWSGSTSRPFGSGTAKFTSWLPVTRYTA